MANDKTNFNMQLTTTQKEIMDFVTEVVYEGYNFSKADTVIELFRDRAIGYLGINFDGRLNDDTLLALLKEEKKEHDFSMIRTLGADKFEKLIATSKSTYPNRDFSQMEELLNEYKEREVK